jgi:hypothetical protein
MKSCKSNNRPQQSPSMLILATRCFAVSTPKQHEERALGAQLRWWDLAAMNLAAMNLAAMNLAAMNEMNKP